MSNIVFEEPPGYANAKQDYPAIARELHAHTHTWGRIATFSKRQSATTTAYRIRHGLIKAFAPQGTYEAVARTVNGESVVYARHIGTGDTP